MPVAPHGHARSGANGHLMKLVRCFLCHARSSASSLRSAGLSLRVGLGRFLGLARRGIPYQVGIDLACHKASPCARWAAGPVLGAGVMAVGKTAVLGPPRVICRVELYNRRGGPFLVSRHDTHAPHR